MTVPPPAVLEVTALERSRYQYRLDRPGQAFGAVRRDFEVDVDPEFVAMYCGQIDAAVLDAANASAPGAVNETLRDYGRRLYEALLPRQDHKLTPLRTALRELTEPLMICERASKLQWELLYDDEQENFFGLSYDVSRQLRTTEAPAVQSIASDTLRCLLIADPSADDGGNSLPHATAEVNQLCEWFKKRDVACDVLAGEEATRAAMVDRLTRRRYDVIHYAGHVDRDDETNKHALRLADGMLPGDWFKTHLPGGSLVFLNGCSSADAGGGMLAHVERLTDAMLAGGARVVVGTIYPVVDIGAQAFAEAFYSELLRGEHYGAAMRRARLELSKRPDCGASWTAFVMYGDPSLTLVGGDSRRPPGVVALLESVGVEVEALDHGAVEVLRTAAEQARVAGVLATAHLFAALIASKDTTLKDRLEACDVEIDELRRAFQHEIDGGAKALDDAAGTLELSASARAIIEAAAAAARTESRPVAEDDVRQAFVSCETGTTQQILRQLFGIDLSQVLRDETALELGRAIAINQGHRMIGSPQLFQGLLSVQPSPVARALRRIGLAPSTFEPQRPSKAELQAPDGADGPVVHSTSVEEILVSARADAAADERAEPDDEDVFRAFVEHGGGTTGVELMRSGFPLDVLVSPLFGGDGCLRADCFDDGARAALEAAVDCAQRKHDERLTYDHVLYGLLLADGTLADAIRTQDSDPERLADRLFVRLPAKLGRRANRNILRIDQLRPELLVALLDADRRRKEDQGTLIDEHHLASALLSDGGGSAGVFLDENGIRRRGLPQ